MPCKVISRLCLNSVRTYLANVHVFDLEQAVLQSSTATSINVVADASHPLRESLQPAVIWRSLTTKEGLLRDSGE